MAAKTGRSASSDTDRFVSVKEREKIPRTGDRHANARKPRCGFQVEIKIERSAGRADARMGFEQMAHRFRNCVVAIWWKG